MISDRLMMTEEGEGLELEACLWGGSMYSSGEWWVEVWVIWDLNEKKRGGVREGGREVVTERKKRRRAISIPSHTHSQPASHRLPTLPPSLPPSPPPSLTRHPPQLPHAQGRDPPGTAGEAWVDVPRQDRA